ncbi:Larval cuticle protein 8 [Lucilia cuprina]|uniref:Larval cuticle protein 8 n=1 Tax=Lucilia cuprina TaxID=7375 RepID=A0A0L0CP36_LUCCU|nr:Larval cuticle protein 8 [Lucilia cuprina]
MTLLFFETKKIKMKFIIVFAALFAVALAAPRPEDAVVLRSESEVGPESYQYAYETSDGNKAEEQGQLKNVGTEEEAIVVKGSYSFVADDGQTYTVNYVADENGFQPQGAHLPLYQLKITNIMAPITTGINRRTNKQIKMKFIIVFAALFAVALAAPRPEDATVLRSESEVGPESFQYSYATSDGVEAEAQGQLKNVGTDEEAIVVKGSFSFVADDGQTYTVNYVADENGFQPQGAHLPVLPVPLVRWDYKLVVFPHSSASPWCDLTCDLTIYIHTKITTVCPCEKKQIKMKFIIVFAALFAVALAAPRSPAPRPEDATVLRSESEVGPESFQYAYATSDGVEAEAQGQLKNVGTDEEAIVVKGSYSFVADDGQTYTVNYVADENGTTYYIIKND